jgi:hypothetical protein
MRQAALRAILSRPAKESIKGLLSNQRCFESVGSPEWTSPVDDSPSICVKLDQTNAQLTPRFISFTKSSLKHSVKSDIGFVRPSSVSAGLLQGRARIVALRLDRDNPLSKSGNRGDATICAVWFPCNEPRAG